MGALPACSYVQSLFPDKERDYQYTSEVPLLNWPAELRRNNPAENAEETPLAPSAGDLEDAAVSDTNNVPPPDERNGANATAEAPRSSENTAETGESVAAVEASDAQDTVSSIEIVKYDDGEGRLRLGASYSKSWRLVNKALLRNLIEVTGRSHDIGNVKIQYDPEEKKVKDDSFMDEIDFIFEGINTNDQEYNLKFEEHDQKTDVIVLDEEHLPLLNNNAAMRLLKVLADTIKADLAEKSKPDAP